MGERELDLGPGHVDALDDRREWLADSRILDDLKRPAPKRAISDAGNPAGEHRIDRGRN